MYKSIPAVFAVEDTYQIMVRTEEKSFVWVKIGDQCFYDHSNGILRSNTTIHRITVLSALLDKTGKYTVYKIIIFQGILNSNFIFSHIKKDDKGFCN